MNIFLTHIYKSYKSIFVIICLLTLNACLENNSSTIPPEETNENTSLKLSLTPVFSTLSFDKPLAMYQSKNLDWFVVEQSGKIKLFKTTDQTSKTFIDISDKIQFDSEMGLLGMALHPDFDNNGIFFLSYTNKNSTSIISRFESTNFTGDSQSEKIILSVSQPYSNHNGGQISFGPDGYLYIGFGDGGLFGDPKDNSQNIETLLGALLRIDVNNTDTYNIPSDNPFVSKSGKDEIYAYGLRNPWRWSFDKETGDLWLADVGQNQWEEINLIKSGGNYGWNIMEANHCYLDDNCNSSPYIAPVYEYSHSEGRSITGGYVYRGKGINQLSGIYLYADYVSGKIWGLSKNQDASYRNQLLIESSTYISSFAEDQAGNLYIIGHQSGKIYQITEATQP